jgi:hypothetical protein
VIRGSTRGQPCSHSLRARCQFPRERIPEAFAFLDLWQTMRISIPRYSQWCEEEYVTITCKPRRGNLPSKFSPIFVLTNPTAEGIHSKPTPSLHFRPILICLRTRIETCTDPTDLPGTQEPSDSKSSGHDLCSCIVVYKAVTTTRSWDRDVQGVQGTGHAWRSEMWGSSPQPNRGLVSTFACLRWSLQSNHYLSRISRKLYRVLGESLLQSLVSPMAPIKYRVAMMLETLPLRTLHHLLPNSHSCRLCKPSDDRAAQSGRMHCAWQLAGLGLVKRRQSVLKALLSLFNAHASCAQR